MFIFDAIHRWDVITFHKIGTARFRKFQVLIAHLLSKSGDGWLYPLSPLLFFLLGYPAKTFFFTLLSTCLVERSIYLMAKNSFRRQRPANILPNFSSLLIAPDEFSFPSGHTSGAFLIATTIVMVFGIAFLPVYIWAAGIGLSRVVLGMHFPSDIFAGALMGSGIALSIGSILI